ncbi:NHL domain-containing thioredoxin family protein [Yinghuangia sp. ASG 101]|uniref:NHL domain-containing thioredoxin family protein n=1 Tax=Yinghuangia sp. ASG 101 TaxID=2896848 RepID=UPI001E35F00C|nr:NHL domain-containing thioredoxin family protein [Yinghuangia sp. ASG 101]UGQ15173.1 NHL domain-containing thioredoxin family protein [Yinghuangia sp. ASG 101]
MSSTPRRARVRAPELVGAGGWINTGGKDVTLSDLRGKCVLVDFWTFCCVNCLHVLDELRELEEKYRDVLVVVGVHSPKFAHETDHGAVLAAVERYDVRHAVLDDPDMTTWRQYAVRAWPTLVVIDPEGYVVAQLAGEGHAHAVDALVTELVAEHAEKGTLHRGDGPYVPAEAPRTDLRFPGKALRLPSGTLLASDSGHHSLVELADDGTTVLRRIGGGQRGLVDGGPRHASFAEPQGLALLPAEVAAHVGYDVVVADTANHALRGVSLATGTVRTVAGTGRQWWQGAPTSGASRSVDLSSPWDVAWFGGRVVVAMAGVHQLWEFDPVGEAVDVLAGTTNEGLEDGPVDTAWFAQPSGLAVSPDGHTLWIADAETSALRELTDGQVTTAVGEGLFDFGLRDGDASQALFQHPLGVTTLPDGSVAVADTYNGALRRFDPVTGAVTTLVAGLREPSDAVVVADDDGVYVMVVESAAHRLTRVRVPDEAPSMPARAHRTARPPVEIGPGSVRLRVVFDAPPGQKLDDRYGPATRLLVEAGPPGMLRSGEGPGTALTRTLVLDDAVGDGVLHVSAMAASCDALGPDGKPAEYPACHVHQQDWGVPVRVVEGGPDELVLVLAGLDAPDAGPDA